MSVNFLIEHILPYFVNLFLMFIAVYIAAKAKILASKEDLDQITKIVKSVEIKFDRSLEKSKTKNQLLTLKLEEYTKMKSTALFSLYKLGSEINDKISDYEMILLIPIDVDTDKNKKIEIDKMKTDFELLYIIAMTTYNSENLKNSLQCFKNQLDKRIFGLSDIDEINNEVKDIRKQIIESRKNILESNLNFIQEIVTYYENLEDELNDDNETKSNYV